jgi:hypothetical protein
VGHLILGTQTPLDQVPWLQELVSGAQVRPLEPSAQERMFRLMGNRYSTRVTSRVHQQPGVAGAASAKASDDAPPKDGLGFVDDMLAEWSTQLQQEREPDVTDRSLREPQPTAPAQTQVPLPRFQQRIVEILRSHDSEYGLYVSPDIPADKASNAAESCALRPDDTILGLVDWTKFGTARNALVFGEHGFYYHNKRGHRRGPDFVAYCQFPGIRFGTWGQSITLGGDRYCDTADSSMSGDKIIEILDAVKGVVIEFQEFREYRRRYEKGRRR